MKVRNNKIYFGALSAEELTGEFGSPLFVYDRQKLIDQYRAARRAFTWNPTQIFYACKANSNPDILKLFCKLGAGIDAVSPGEIYFALKSGFRKRDILLTGTNLSEADILFARKKQTTVNVDSVSVLKRYGEILSTMRVSLRLNPDIKAGGHSYLETGHLDSKFGIAPQDMPLARKLLKEHGISVTGLHQHIGSDVVDIKSFIASLDHLFTEASYFKGLEFIDIGGGFKVRYRKKDTALDIGRLGRAVSDRMAKFCGSYGRPLKLILEPGKFLVSDAGYLLTAVQAIKRGRTRTFIGTDTGMNHLIRPALYGAYHKIVNASNVSHGSMQATITGNICESGDILGAKRLISKVSEGDILCIFNAGAYGFSMASTYNARPLPAEVLIENGKPRLIRKRQTFRQLYGK